jgi:DNA invertase Pin-like site-specific DNA recombinase
MTATSSRNRAALTAVNTPIVADAYIRLSDLRDTDLTEEGIGKTFADREKALREFAARLGWTIDRVVIENDLAKSKTGKQRGASAFKRRRVYQADGTYTLRVWRPGFQSILDDMKSGRINALVAEDLDRAMRDPRDLEDLIDIAEAHKINARSLAGSLTFTDGGTDAEITMARVMVTMGNKSSRDTVRRVAASRERKAYAGEYGGGTRPYGFEKDGVTKIWHECAVIATASRRVLQGISLKEQVRDLKAAGVPTTTGTGQWDTRTLKAILIRERNAGIQIYQGEEIGSAPWAPIIPVDMYREVVRILRDRAVNNNPSNAPVWFGSCIYECGKPECDGGRIVVNKSGKRTPTYVCTNGHLGRRVEPVDVLVVGTIIEMLSQPEAAGLLVRKGKAPIDSEKLRAECATIRRNLVELAEDRAEGLIDRAQMLAGTRKGQTRLAEIDELLASAVVESPLAPMIAAADVRTSWDQQPLSVRRAALGLLLDVTILPAPEGQSRIFDPRLIRITPKEGYTIPSSIGRSVTMAA